MSAPIQRITTDCSNDNELNRVREYIINNPQRWELDRENQAAMKKCGRSQVSGFSGNGPIRLTEFIDSLLTPETRERLRRNAMMSRLSLLAPECDNRVYIGSPQRRADPRECAGANA